MTKPSCVIVDIDGTIAKKGDRGYFEWDKVDRDIPIPVIIDLLKALSPVHTIVLMSGRDGICRELTEAWLREHDVPYHALVMRQAGDKRKDAIVKKELYETYIKPYYTVQFVLDEPRYGGGNVAQRAEAHLPPGRRRQVLGNATVHSAPAADRRRSRSTPGRLTAAKTRIRRHPLAGT